MPRVPLWLDGWRSPLCWRVSGSSRVAVLRVLLPRRVLLHGFAYRRDGRFHAAYYAEGDLHFRWATGAAPWSSVHLSNDVVSDSHRRFSVAVDAEVVERFEYRRVRLPGRTWGEPPTEADRDWYLAMATTPEHFYEFAVRDFSKGWAATGDG